MTDLRPLWKSIEADIEKVLPGWFVDTAGEDTPGVLVFNADMECIASATYDDPASNRDAAMRVMDELESRRLALFASRVNSSSTRRVYAASTSSADSAYYPLADLAAPYVECLAKTFKALKNGEPVHREISQDVGGDS